MERPQNWRLWLAITLLVLSCISFLAGAAMVAASELPVWLRGLGAALVFPSPELLSVVAVAVLGKPGYQYLKSALLGFLRRYAPPKEVSRTRYKVGLTLFLASFLLPWLSHYFGSRIPGFESVGTWFYFISDSIFLSSLFVLGGDFWEKLRSLFSYEAKVAFPLAASSQEASA